MLYKRIGIPFSCMNCINFVIRRLPKIAFFSLLLCGCKKEASVKRIDSGVNIMMRENLDSINRNLLFYCSTEREYGCCNYVIGNTFNISSSNIDIDFNGIIIPGICLTAFGPATTTIDLGILTNGPYYLDIKVEKRRSKGLLIVNSEYYIIILFNKGRLQIINSPLFRIPANTIWGTIGYHTSSTAMLAQTFIDSLQLLGTSQQTYKSGDYGYFQISEDGQILPPQNHGYFYVLPYIYNYSGNSSALRNLVKNYGTNFGSSMNIVLYTTKGEIFRSWTL